jgi:hypothetical protein
MVSLGRVRDAQVTYEDVLIFVRRHFASTDIVFPKIGEDVATIEVVGPMLWVPPTKFVLGDNALALFLLLLLSRLLYCESPILLLIVLEVPTSPQASLLGVVLVRHF